MAAIKQLEERIENYKNYIKEQEELFVTENGIRKKDLKRNIIFTKKRLIKLEKQLEKIQLDQMKEKLSRAPKYSRKILADIDNYDYASQANKTWQDTALDMELLELDGEKNIQQLQQRSNHFFKKFVYAYRTYLERSTNGQTQFVDTEHGKNSFYKNELKEAFKSLSKEVEKVPTIFEFSEDIAKAYMPKKDIKDIIKINDSYGVDKLHEQLCTLYGYTEPDKYEIYAIHGYDHTTYGDKLGESTKTFMSETYDKKLGQTTELYIFNKKTGEIEELGKKVMNQYVNDSLENNNSSNFGENFFPHTISRGKKLELHNLDRKKEYTEIDTLDCAGLKLSFYRDDSGVMRVGRNRNGIIEPAFSDTLEELKRIKDKKNNLEELIISSSVPKKDTIVQNDMEEKSVSEHEEKINDESNGTKIPEELIQEATSLVYFDSLFKQEQELEEEKRKIFDKMVADKKLSFGEEEGEQYYQYFLEMIENNLNKAEERQLSLREELKEDAFNIDLDSMEEAVSHEKKDREQLESRRRLL